MDTSIKTSECVSPMHPDKMCDRISDTLVDSCLDQNANARCAIEVCGGHGHIFVTGEVSGAKVSDFDIYSAIDQVTGKAKEYKIHAKISQQSSEIAQGVDTGGAGDQGIMVGYACSANEAMIPQEHFLARSLCQYLFGKYGTDGKTQITLNDYGHISALVASFCGAPKKELEKDVQKWLGDKDFAHNIKKHLNPAGDWNVGGFDADAGLTGRKLIVDNYGPQIPIGGGAFSGKDATKVDRSGAYMARKLAVTLLKKLESKEVIVKLAYAIGVKHPVMATFESRKQNKDGSIEVFVGSIEEEAEYDLTPRGIIETLKLDRPQFTHAAKWGSFGNGFIWDKPFKHANKN